MRISRWIYCTGRHGTPRVIDDNANKGENMVFRLAAAIAVIVVNILLKVNQTEWLFTLVLIGLAWMAEIFSTAIEKLADRVTKEQDPLIGQVKDLASGAVLVICLFAIVYAVIIYLTYILR